MIIYNSRLAKAFCNKKRHYFMILGCCFTCCKYLEGWEEMELRIHERQYLECLLLALLPALVLSLLFSWWFMLVAFYVIMYCMDWKNGSDIILRSIGRPWNIVVMHCI